MDENEEKPLTAHYSLGFMQTLTCILVAAKAFGFAHYSWAFVFWPLIIGTGVMICELIVIGIGAAANWLVNKFHDSQY